MPALPMMSMVDRLAGACGARALDDVRVLRWVPFPAGPVRLRTIADGVRVALQMWRDANDPALSRFEDVATATIAGADDAPPACPALDGDPEPDPYAAGVLFHGPAFRYLRRLVIGRDGASAVLDAGGGTVPRGALGQGLLDALTHAIPHDALWRWSPEIARDEVAYPWRIPSFRVYGGLPESGSVRVEVRFRGLEVFEGRRLPVFDVQLVAGTPERVVVALRLVEVLLPKGPIGTASPADRIAFLDQRRFVPGVALSRAEGEATVAATADKKGSDWLPGNVARIYDLPAGADAIALVAAKDHVARRAFVHPSRVDVAPDLGSAIARVRPLRRHPIAVVREPSRAIARDAGPPLLDLGPIRSFWRNWFDIGPWPVEDLYYGLIERFVGDVVIADPDAFAAVRGRSCLYLANHQVGVESLLFSVLLSALSGVSTVTLAKAEHRATWLGRLIHLSFEWPGVTDPGVITFFDREDRAALMGIIGELGNAMRTVGKSVMVHVEGTRSVTCRKPVEKMSSAFVDMALAVGAPIVPVRFSGGLPVEPLAARIEFPLGCGRQDYWVGRPILPEELAALPLKDRKAVVIGAINGLGPGNDVEEPLPPDPAFAGAASSWADRTGATPEHATLFAVLAARTDPSPPIARLLDGARKGELRLGDGAEDRWLAELATRLFGERGPRVVRG
jgi:1-acyl-sn-glycerol-3-phosphate acyltransferase